MELYQLYYFKTVARTQNFRQAAVQLAISQPALTKAIHKLEQDVGMELFDRIHKSVRLNYYGQEFLKSVDHIIRELENGVRSIQQLRNPEQGFIRLGFIQTLGISIVPQILSAFVARYPQIHIEIVQAGIKGCFDLIEANDIDVSIVSTYTPIQQIEWHPLVVEELYGYCSQHHPLAGQSAINLSELQDFPFIGYHPSISMHHTLKDWCKAAGFTPTIAFEGIDVPTMAGLISANLGIGILPPYIGIEALPLHKFKVTNIACTREIGIAACDPRYRSKSSELFITFAKHYFQQSND